jgi:hypothetical protein
MTVKVAGVLALPTLEVYLQKLTQSLTLEFAFNKYFAR